MTYEVRALIRKKLIFGNRPTPLRNNANGEPISKQRKLN